MSILSEEVHARLEEIHHRTAALEKRLENAPEGRLRVSSHGNRIQYYQVTDPGDNTGRYLRNSEMPFVQKLAQKKYDVQALKLLRQETKLLENLEQFYTRASVKKIKKKDAADMSFFYSGPEELLLERSNAARKNLIIPIAADTETFVREWLSESYEKKEFPDADTEYYTGSGIRVRSKTELIIAEMLEKRGIPFHYERPLYLKGQGTVHPDFTVLNKTRRKTMYWEHMGMMDDERYRDYALEKIHQYILAGYLPGRDLILTHETAARPVRTVILERVIEEYLS